jgi:hypothetical protein
MRSDVGTLDVAAVPGQPAPEAEAARWWPRGRRASSLGPLRLVPEGIDEELEVLWVSNR